MAASAGWTLDHVKGYECVPDTPGAFSEIEAIMRDQGMQQIEIVIDLPYDLTCKCSVACLIRATS